MARPRACLLLRQEAGLLYAPNFWKKRMMDSIPR